MANYSVAWLLPVIMSFFMAGAEPELVSDLATDNELKQVEAYDFAHLTDSSKKKLVSTAHIALGDTGKVKKNPNDRAGDATRQDYVTPLYLRNPSNFQTDYELDEDMSGFTITEKVGSVDFRRPSYISYEDYYKYRKQKGMRDYLKEQSLASNEKRKSPLIPTFDLDEISDVFGGGTVEIRPTGYATLDFALVTNFNDNPSIAERNRKTTNFDFDPQIQLGVIGKIGNLMRLNVNFDTQATFDFENELKLQHKGTEDQILQQVEAGNVSLPLGNSLIQGRQNLFGLKGKFKFGPVNVTAIGSIERGQVESVSVAGGGAVETSFSREASQYEMNRHFFLSHFFRAQYEDALENLPIITSSVRINRIQVWVVQGGATQNTRNGLGFIDLGENIYTGESGLDTTNIFNDRLVNPNPSVRFPSNGANDLFDRLQSNDNFRQQNSTINQLAGIGMENTLDFEIAGNMRLLNPNEYNLNQQLGYLSLRSPLNNNQVLFVAYSYSVNGIPFQVGEFSDDVPSDGRNSNVLFLKMLKPSVTRPLFNGEKYPLWDLMMKNIYNIGFGLQRDGFFLDVKYESGTSAGKVNFFPEGSLKNRQLLQVLNLDRLTNHTSPGPDNYFDFIEGLTILSDQGQIIFPALEPFGSHLTRLLNNANDSANYVFQALYDDTQQGAIQNFPHLDRFTIEGYYRSASGSEIPLNTFNLEEGSVTVSAGGQRLIEGTDFIVDYFGGKITIINQAVLTSGQKIDVDYESSSLYNIQTKTLLGARAELSTNESYNVGATILNLREQPFNQKQTIGDEPINNTLWGLDGSYRAESEFLTKLIDRVPLLSTKAPSNINFSGEFAQFIPGQPKLLATSDEQGVAFIDDFESAKTPFNLQQPIRWRLASFPQSGGVPSLENSVEPLSGGFNRARMSWYRIDPSFYQNLFDFPIPRDENRNNYARQIQADELFPTATRSFGQNLQFTFDLRYTPEVRGPYNYQASPTKLNNEGEFTNPKENWAGIMREIDVNNDFEATNVEFLEFWMMDPFLDDPNHTGGDFYINLGLISEDVLPDQSLSQENALPKDAADINNIDTTAWGRMPFGNNPVNAFSNVPAERTFQDVGYDGLGDENERTFFQDFLSDVAIPLGGTGSSAYQLLQNDPSSDNFVHHSDDFFNNGFNGQDTVGIVDRYTFFNGPDGNSPVNENNDRFSRQGNNEPDTEDINDNGSINFAEQYWEYKLKLHPDSLQPGQNFIVDRINTTIVVDGRSVPVRWFQVRIPIAEGKPINGVTDFKSISYMRMYMTGFEKEVITRLTEFQFVSTQWRRFTNNLAEDAPVINPPEPPFAEFEVGSVSFEENSEKLPFNYVLPPGVEQQSINGNTQAGFLANERALALQVCGLEDGDARAVFKGVRQDFRNYTRLKMWVHAEATENGLTAPNFADTGDAVLFVRLGLDNDFNYYEYELPLVPSDPNGGAGNLWNIWANELDIELLNFAIAKSARNNAGTGVGNRFRFSEGLPEGHAIVIKGTPKLSEVRNIMIGVRNPKDMLGRPVCMEVWVNELRLTDYDQRTGWAANANLDLKLADIGSVRASMSYRSAGFGPLQQRITERTQEDVFRYDIAANLSFDKFFPSTWNLSMPVFATYGEEIISPEFNPQEADVSTDKLIRELSKEEADAFLDKIQDYTRNRSISFNNWKINKGPGATKTHFWDPHNFDFTYAFNETFSRNVLIESLTTTQHRAVINYRYNFNPFSFEPFKKLKFKPLKDINFSPVPASLTVAVEADRRFEERQLRPSSEFGGNVDPTFTKDFRLTRTYNLVWNFTRNMAFNFSATNNGRVDEVRGRYRTALQRERDSVGTLLENLLHFGRSVEQVGDFTRRHDNLINFGRTINYQHNFNFAWQLPFQSFPFLNWITSTINYSGSFNWQQAPEITRGLENADSTRMSQIGGVISNTQNLQAEARVNLRGLYDKVPPLKKILARQKEPARRPNPRIPIQPPGTETEEDTTKKESKFLKVLKAAGSEIVRMIFSVQNVTANYSINANTVLPNYLPKTDNFGLDFRYEDPFGGGAQTHLPPTFGFLAGSQRDIRGIASTNNWISRDTTIANLYLQNKSEQFRARTSIEILKGLRLDVNIRREQNTNSSEFFRWNESLGTHVSLDPQRNGTFGMSYIFINSAFEQTIIDNGEDGVELVSEFFDKFSESRRIISQRLSEENPNDGVLNRNELVNGEFFNGYLGDNPDVLIPAFRAAYGIIGPEKVDLDKFPLIPLPNWDLTFEGLQSLEFMKKAFQSFTIRHTYSASYNIGNFTLDPFSIDPSRPQVQDGYPVLVKDAGEDIDGNPIQNYIPFDNVTAVQIQENFRPFIGFNLALKSGLTASINYDRSRTLTFSNGSLQLADNRSQGLSLNIGYRKDKLNWNFRLGSKDINLTNSLKAELRLDMKDTRVFTRQLSTSSIGLQPIIDDQITQGTINWNIQPSIDYVVNDRVNVRLFFERRINDPFTSLTYYTSFSRGGFQIRFTLAN